MKKQTPNNKPRQRRKTARCLTPKMTMRKATMILLCNTLAGSVNADGSVNQPWPDEQESLAAANMVAEQVVEDYYNQQRCAHANA